MNGMPSGRDDINCGVPQGSCLGLFLTYISFSKLALNLIRTQAKVVGFGPNLKKIFDKTEQPVEYVPTEMLYIKL